MLVLQRLLQLVKEPLQDGRIIFRQRLHLLKCVMIVLITKLLSDLLLFHQINNFLHLGGGRIAPPHISHLGNYVLDTLLMLTANTTCVMIDICCGSLLRAEESFLVQTFAQLLLGIVDCGSCRIVKPAEAASSRLR